MFAVIPRPLDTYVSVKIFEKFASLAARPSPISASGTCTKETSTLIVSEFRH